MPVESKPADTRTIHKGGDGERLFIGRTVKTHLAYVFTKLGVSTRSELAAEVTRRGL